MTFRYRVILKDGEFAIYEVFFDEAGKASACTKYPLSPAAATLDDLRYELEMMLKSLGEEVLEYKFFEEKESNS